MCFACGIHNYEQALKKHQPTTSTAPAVGRTATYVKHKQWMVSDVDSLFTYMAVSQKRVPR